MNVSKYVWIIGALSSFSVWIYSACAFFMTNDYWKRSELITNMIISCGLFLCFSFLFKLVFKG